IAAQVRDWLARLTVGSALAAVEPVKVKGANATTVFGLLQKTRSAIIKLQSAIRAVQTTAMARDDLLKAIGKHVSELAKDGTPQIDVASGRVIWPDVVPSPMQFAAWLIPEVLTDALLDQIADVKGSGISESERRRRLAELQAELLVTERTEET